MTSRPRRSAAAKATESISVQSKWADSNDRSGDSPVPSRRSGRAVMYRDLPSSPESVSGSMPSRSRQSAARSSIRRSEQFEGGQIVHGKRNRGTKKNYIVDSSPEEDEEDEEDEDEDEDEDEEEEEDEDDDDNDNDNEDLEDQVEVELDEDDAMEEDAEGEVEMDADGDVDMHAAPRRNKITSIKLSRSGNPRNAARVAASRIVVEDDDDDDDDDELSEPDSDAGDETMAMGDDTMADEDAEGEEVEADMAGDGEDDEDEDEDAEEPEDDEGAEAGAAGEQDDDVDSEEEDGGRADTPDLAKMTKRQRARFDEQPQEYMKLSDEVQAKKILTAEQLSMRRQEMARRRRNLSEKRNEEVKMETINKLLKKQAPKTNKKGARGTSPEADAKAAETLIRLVSNKNGSVVAVPSGIMAGPAGDVFGPLGKGNSSGNGSLGGSKMVEEVA